MRAVNISIILLYSLSAVITFFTASAFQQQLHRPTSRSFPRHSKFSLTTLSSSSSSASFASADSSDGGGDDKTTPASNVVTSVRARLREATGFSFTVFRATLRGVTGISLTALYAGTVAATGLWIRKTMSVILSVFPSGFRYFLQPFLILYYTPLIILRLWTGPARKNAAAKHETVVKAWKEAVIVAKQAERDGYWPVVVSDDGYFELNKPPSSKLITMVDNDDKEEGKEVTTTESKNAKLADAMAVAVEQAMDMKKIADDDNERK